MAIGGSESGGTIVPKNIPDITPNKTGVKSQVPITFLMMFCLFSSKYQRSRNIPSAVLLGASAANSSKPHSIFLSFGLTTIS